MNHKFHNVIIKTLAAFSFALGSIQAAAAKEDPEAGKTIFTTRCTSCHAVDKDVVGPALGGVDKVDKIDWIIKFVHGSQAMVKAGDKRAVALFDAHNQTIMPDHPMLSDQDIRNIFAYIDQEADRLASQPKSTAREDDPAPYPTGPHSWWHELIYLDVPGNHTPLKTSDTFVWFTIFGFIFIAIAILLFAINVQSFITKGKQDGDMDY